MPNNRYDYLTVLPVSLTVLTPRFREGLGLCGTVIGDLVAFLETYELWSHGYLINGSGLFRLP